MTEVLKVSSKSTPNAVAGALAGIVRSHGAAEVQVVGAGALNQAIKAVAIARGYVAAAGLDLHCRPTFADIEIDGQSRTAIRLLVESDRPVAPGVDLTVVGPTDLRPVSGREVVPAACLPAPLDHAPTSRPA